MLKLFPMVRGNAVGPCCSRSWMNEADLLKEALILDKQVFKSTYPLSLMHHNDFSVLEKEVNLTSSYIYLKKFNKNPIKNLDKILKICKNLAF